MGHGCLLMPDTFFCRSLIRAHTGSFGDMPKFCDLLVEVGHMTKWWVYSCNKLFLSNFLGSLIRTHRKLCKCVARHFSPIYKNGSNFEDVKKWVMGPSWCPTLFFCGSLIRAQGKIWRCVKMLCPTCESRSHDQMMGLWLQWTFWVQFFGVIN